MQRSKPRCISTQHDLAVARPPYRASLLTRVLKECFASEDAHGAKHRTLLIATVSPSPTDMQHSINTLEHVLLMAPHLHDLAIESVVELPARGAALSHVPVELWTCEEVSELFKLG